MVHQCPHEQPKETTQVSMTDIQQPVWPRWVAIYSCELSSSWQEGMHMSTHHAWQWLVWLWHNYYHSWFRAALGAQEGTPGLNCHTELATWLSSCVHGHVYMPVSLLTSLLYSRYSWHITFALLCVLDTNRLCWETCLRQTHRRRTRRCRAPKLAKSRLLC